MTRLLGKGVKADFGQGSLIVYRSLYELEICHLQTLSQFTKLQFKNLLIIFVFSEFSIELYMIRKIKQISLNAFFFLRKKCLRKTGNASSQ